MTHQCSLALRIVLAELLWLLAVACGSSTLHAADNAEVTRSLRLGIPEFATSAESASLQREGAQLVDLLTARFTREEGFELVERAALDRVLREIALSASGMARPEQAVKVGKLVRADWFLLGSFLRIQGTNFIVAKIVDAQTGVIRDLASVGPAGTNLTENAEALAAFVVSSRKSVRSFGDRLFVAMGAFEDLGVHARYPDFAEQLRAAMTRHYAGTRISVVERSQVNPLLNELRMSRGGLIENRTSTNSAQPAFILVDGLYQSFQDEQSKINLVLRMEAMGGRTQTISLKELPGKPLETKVAEAIESALRDSKSAVLAPNRQAEFDAQIKRGTQLARLDKTHTSPALIPLESQRASRVAVITDAIHAFESALLLDPDSVDAKFYLAACLGDPQIAKREQARDYWREVIAASTNARRIRIVREAIADSYVGEDDLQATEMLTALRKEATIPEEIRRHNTALLRLYRPLFEHGKLNRESLIELVKDSWRTSCRVCESMALAGGRIDSYDAFNLPLEDYSLAFPTSSELRENVARFVSNLIAEFPRLKPYLISGYLRFVGGRSAARPNDVSETELAALWVKKYLDLLAQASQNPQSILAPRSFYGRWLIQDLNVFLGQRDFEMAERVTEVLQKQGRAYMLSADVDQLDLKTGYLSFRREHWKEALTAFERVGDRDVPIPVGIEWPWPKGRIPPGRTAAEACRQRLNSTNGAAQIAGGTKSAGTEGGNRAPNTAGTIEQIPSPKFVKAFPGAEVLFAVDGNRLWVTDQIALYRYDVSSGDAQRMPLAVPRSPSPSPGLSFTALTVARNRVWIGTRDRGLIAFDPNTQTSTNYTVNDGLLTPDVTNLLEAEDRLWVGFDGERGGGGIGYFDLFQNRFIGTMSELPNAVPDKRRSSAGVNLVGGTASPRSRITGIARSPSGQIWTSVMGAVYRYVEKPAKTWEDWAWIAVAKCRPWRPAANSWSCLATTLLPGLWPR